jgi:hypothetical protein
MMRFEMLDAQSAPFEQLLYVAGGEVPDVLGKEQVVALLILHGQTENNPATRGACGFQDADECINVLDVLQYTVGKNKVGLGQGLITGQDQLVVDIETF